MAEVLPVAARLAGRRMNRAVENQTVPLIVIGTAVVPPDVVVVDGGAEEELADIIERLRIGVGNAVAAPFHGPLDKRNVQTIVVGVGQRRILAIVAESRIRPASVVASGGGARGHVLIDGNDEMQPAYMLIANAQSAVRTKLLLDFKAALLRVGVLHVRVHGAEVEQDSRRQRQAAEDVRKHGRSRLRRR